MGRFDIIELSHLIFLYLNKNVLVGDIEIGAYEVERRTYSLVKNLGDGTTTAFVLCHIEKNIRPIGIVTDFNVYRENLLQKAAEKMRQSIKADKYVVVELNGIYQQLFENVELGSETEHFNEARFLKGIYRKVSNRELLRMSSVKLPSRLDDNLISLLINELNELGSGLDSQCQGQEGAPLSKQYQYIVKDIFDFALEGFEIPEGQLELKTQSNNRLDVTYLLSRCSDIPFQKQFLSKFSANKLIVECKNSESLDEVIKGVDQVAKYISKVKGGAIGIVCARKVEDKGSRIKNAISAYLDDGKPILVLCDSDLESFISARRERPTFKLLNDERIGGKVLVAISESSASIAWLQHRYDLLEF
ncbi:hypothetical protein KW493_14045 [Vibrio fluvialis]|nr:hypothetical protein [Vibrio fluvialis]